MELVYLWVEEYKNIKKQGFNFSPRFKCEYDEKTNALTIDENKEYVSIFPENINITAIVGENGSGKSTICECFYDDTYFENIRAIYLKNNKFYSNFEFKIKEEIEIVDLDSLDISNNLNYNNTSRDSVDISDEEIKIKFNSMFFELLKDDISFFDFLDNNYYFDSYLFEINVNKFYDLIFNTKRINLSNYTFHRNYLFKIIIVDILLRIYGKDIDKKVPNSIFEILSKNEFLIDDFLKIIDFCKKEKELDIYKYLTRNNLKKLETFFSIDNYSLKSDYTYLGKKIDFKNELIKYLYYEINILNINFCNSKKNIEFNSLSEGERTQLMLFTKIANNLKSDRGDKNRLYFLDEPDLSLHPNWQRKLINNISIIYKKLEYMNINIHFILTSHSPFILSDLPKENIIFLEEGKQVHSFKENQQTFGANIHTLLSHGFFMKDGLMGEFAKSKISKILKFLSGENKFIDLEVNLLPPLKIQNNFFEKNLKPIIEFIGEDFLKEKLLKMYEIKFPKSNEAKIKELENEIKRLKNASN
ncbi:putative AbiEii toxin of type IV toxin-antitoxin system [Malaciobacter marinus]|jgi:predicted ATPase|uniref:AbiEii toxin of type IV toxin-antitoxin system n=1 Tax=Malaciobacter marinus TaxID=505249 RepID=A0AB36ZWR7_9BACT|nr:AAA family ATPase [Malaciobacter marinus]PPK61662.1 putative AbiEii toxin of type IV toxin-antitoxin system [Malaciobacter marinus]